MTPERKRVFLEELSISNAWTIAAEVAGLPPGLFRQLRRTDQDFREAVAEARRAYKDSLRVEISRRAVAGVLEPIYQSGVLVGYKRVFSDRLALELARAHLKEFRKTLPKDVNVNASASARADVTVDVRQRMEDAARKMTPEQRSRFRDVMGDLRKAAEEAEAN